MGVWVSGGISGGHINPAVYPCEAMMVVPALTLNYKGNIGFCDLPRLPMEKSTGTRSDFKL